MKIKLNSKYGQTISRELVIVQRDNEILFCTDGGQPIASVSISYQTNGDDQLDEKGFYLCFQAENKEDAVSHDSCSVNVFID